MTDQRLIPPSQVYLYNASLGKKNQLLRLMWRTTWAICASWLPEPMFPGWKRTLLRWFGAKIASTASVRSSAKIYNPANLVMLDYSCMDSNVNCYNVAPVTVGVHVTISQGAMLCTASHDIHSLNHTLITKPIVIGTDAWVAAEAFVGMGVTVGDGAVVGARAAVFKDVEPWTIVGGNPAKVISKRVLKD